MKRFNFCGVGFIVGLLPSVCFALPILNQNAPGAESITVFPDHLDRSLYYLAPVSMQVASSESGIPYFSYFEYHSALGKRAAIQATLRPRFNQAQIDLAKSSILRLDRKARFTALPYTNSKLVFKENAVLSSMVVTSECDHIAGMVGDEQNCMFLLNQRGMKVLRPMLKRGLSLSLDLEYEIDGVVQKADGHFDPQVNTYRLSGRIGDAELAKYPELFRDSKGRVIQELVE